jgi:hypothetical protein
VVPYSGLFGCGCCCRCWPDRFWTSLLSRTAYADASAASSSSCARTLRVWLRSVRLRLPRNTHRYPSRKRKSPGLATGASFLESAWHGLRGHPPSSALIMIQRTPSHPVPCWLRNYSAVTRQRCSGSLAMLSPCAAPRRESNPAASPFVPVVHVAQRLAFVVAHDEAAPLCP